MTERSNRREVRNPLLALPGIRKLLALPAPIRSEIAAASYEAAADARARADTAWFKNKGPMAVYWKGVGAYARHLGRAMATAMSLEVRDLRQATVAEWCAAAFGIEHATNLAQRAVRFREEAEELYQAAMAAAGVDAAAAIELAHRQTDHVHSRPVGTIGQELGGVGVTTLALANAAGLSADAEEMREVDRVLAKPLAHFARRNAEKNAAGFDVTGAYPSRAA